MGISRSVGSLQSLAPELARWRSVCGWVSALRTSRLGNSSTSVNTWIRNSTLLLNWRVGAQFVGECSVAHVEVWETIETHSIHRSAWNPHMQNDLRQIPGWQFLHYVCSWVKMLAIGLWANILLVIRMLATKSTRKLVRDRYSQRSAWNPHGKFVRDRYSQRSAWNPHGKLVRDRYSQHRCLHSLQ